MQVLFDHIRLDKAYEVDESLDREAFEALVSSFEEHRAASDLRVRLRLRRINDRNVIAEGRLTGEVAAPCARCLEPVSYPLDIEVLVTFIPEPSPHARSSKKVSDDDEDELELTADDLDVMTYSKGVIDLDALIRDSLLLELQPFPPCREADPARCADYAARIASLGEDAEERAAESAEPPIDPRWAGLLALKNKQTTDDDEGGSRD